MLVQHSGGKVSEALSMAAEVDFDAVASKSTVPRSTRRKKRQKSIDYDCDPLLVPPKAEKKGFFGCFC